jgi:hypothetical protein
MEVASLVSFSSRRHPFAVRAEPCLDLDCHCGEADITLTEVVLDGSPLPQPLSFSFRVDLSKFVEVRPPRRSPNVEALVREFLARFPESRIKELVDDSNFQRTRKRRLSESRIQGSIGDLLVYSEVIRPSGGIRQSGRNDGYFYVHQGRELLLEDQYCPNPACDCDEVVIEFWERTKQARPEYRIDVRRLLMARIGFDGKLHEIKQDRESPELGKELVRTWLSECRYQLDEFRRRYGEMKEVGKRSFPTSVPARPASLSERAPVLSASLPSVADYTRSGRNDPCPCGSGLKFKRCCWHRFAGS